MAGKRGRGGTRAAGGGGESNDSETTDVHLLSTFHRSVDEGQARLERKWPDLVSTGLVGGIDVSLGILALFIVEDATESRLLGGLAFSIGFIAVTLGKSELFTENFLVPVAAVVARKAPVLSLLRLWLVTAIMNLVGGWAFAWLIIYGRPEIERTAVEAASFYPAQSDAALVALGFIAGSAITLMTWMEHAAKSEISKIISVVAIAFLLAATPPNHIIVVSIEMFVAIESGAAAFGYVDWARVAGWAAVSNMAGGLLLVTTLRLAQVGWEEIRKERARDPDEPREEG